MAKSHLKLVAPATGNRTVQPVPPGRRPNAELRSREHLTEAEIERIIDAAKSNRHGHRDATMLLAAFRHGLRAAELVDLRSGSGGLPNGHPACAPGQENMGHDTRALQAYLGHRNIQHAVRYTELSPTRFKNFWRD
jgi:site-specific recombinase XerD